MLKREYTREPFFCLARMTASLLTFSELVLDKNELRSLPWAIGSLKLLRILNLAQNQ